MLKYLPITPFVLAIVLVACTGSDPVAEDAAAPSEEMLGDAGAEGLAAPANAAAAEAAVQQATPLPQNGMLWTLNGTEKLATFGAAGDAPSFSVQCRPANGGGRELVVTRGALAPDGEKGTLSFTGNGSASSLPVRGVSPKAGEAYWQAIVKPGDETRAVARAFAGSGVVQIGVSNGPGLPVPASPEAQQILQECAA